MAFQIILQLRGSIDIIVLDGSTGENFSPRQAKGIDNIVLFFVLLSPWWLQLNFLLRLTLLLHLSYYWLY